MPTYTAQQLNGEGTPTEELTGLVRFSLTNPSNSDAYFTVETVRNATGSYTDQPTNALGVYNLVSNLDRDTLITSSYISSIVVPPGLSAYTFTPTATVAISSSMLRATGGITLTTS